MRPTTILTFATLILASVGDASAGEDPGPLVRSLWLVQRYGTADACDPRNDQQVKGTLAKALGQDGELTLSKMGVLMDAESSRKLAGSNDRLSASEIRTAVEAAVPGSRERLLPNVRAHADYLTTTFDLIDEPHR